MEIKLRRKGEIIMVDGFSSSSIPVSMKPPAGLEGIDLTGYPVVYATFGRHGDQKASELAARCAGAIVVYKYEWRNGWGEGVLLPANFNPSRVRFYESAAQVKSSAEEAVKKQSFSLRETVDALGMRAYARDDGGVEYGPKQEAYCSEWMETGYSLEEVLKGVEARRSMWQEWNDRALSMYTRRGIENPGHGNIELIFCHPKLPSRPYPKVFIGYYKREPDRMSQRAWIALELRDGQWVELEDLTGWNADNIRSYLAHL